MKLRAFMVLALAGAASPALASLSFSGGPLSENFDALTATTVTGAFPLPTGTHTAIPTLTAWAGTKVAGTGTTAMNFFADPGTGNSGGLYSYAITAGERALGGLASGSNTGAFGVQVVNNTLGSLTEFTVSFNGEEYRKAIPASLAGSAAVNSLAFAWGVSGAGLTGTNFLNDPSMTAHAPGNVVGTTPLVFGATPVNVFTALGTVSVTITGLNVAPGQSIFVRWNDFNDVGNDAGLSIDNFGFSAVPTPGALALMGLGGLVAARRRRA